MQDAYISQCTDVAVANVDSKNFATDTWGVKALDLLGSCTLLILSAPLMLLIYLLVQASGHPALFGHPRVGYGGKTFKCYKFRTMVLNADEVLARHLANNESARDEWDRDQKLRSDPRITRLGAFLRRTSLDELPQLVNVLRGEMSLVGPRPIVQSEVARYGRSAHYYFSVKPGITGKWQVSGRNDLSYEERVRIDTEYVQTRNLFTDILILFQTIQVVISGRGAN